MLKVCTVCTVAYTCTLTEEDEQKVRNYAKENNVELDDAIKDLHESDEIDVYGGDYRESDSCTEEVSLSNHDEEYVDRQ